MKNQNNKSRSATAISDKVLLLFIRLEPQFRLAARWYGPLIKMRVKPRPSGRGRKARSDIENVAAMAD